MPLRTSKVPGRDELRRGVGGLLCRMRASGAGLAWSCRPIGGARLFV
jgi:hypothetical protein